MFVYVGKSGIIIGRDELEFCGENMIKSAVIEDARILAELAIKMWDDASISELQQGFEELVVSDKAKCFIKYVNGMAVGFAQCQLRTDYVEGTDGSPVGYLEGIFVEEKYRKCGYARALLKECEKWAKEKQCTELASDCELVNKESLCFHIALGFEEANRIICFKKEI